MVQTSTAVLALTASTATAQEATHAFDLGRLTCAVSPLRPLVETASVYGDRAAEGLYTTHARVGAGAVVPPHTHTNSLPTFATWGSPRDVQTVRPRRRPDGRGRRPSPGILRPG